MKYLESDEVKAFHSHLNHLQVLEEREMQLRLKKERLNAEGMADKALVHASLEKCKEQETEEVQLQLLNRLQRVQLAQVHIAQAKQRKLYDYEEKKSLFDYGRKLASEDKAYNEEQKNLVLKKRQEELNRKRILDEMRTEAIERKATEKHEAEEEERITKAWAAHQEYKLRIKQKVEDDWKMKLYRIRTEIGENIHKQAIDATEKEREVREQQELEAEKKAKEEAERKALKKKQNHKELKEKAAQKTKDIEEGKEALVKFKLDALAYEQELQTKREKIKKTETEITKYNRVQSARRVNARQAERMDALNDTRLQQIQDQERKEQLQEYIKSVAAEPWAAQSYRVKSYLNTQLQGSGDKNRRGRSAPSRRDSHTETHARIGFSGTSYSAIDLVGTNEICRGTRIG